MKQPQTIQIIIPQLCSENWDLMTPANGGRHCGLCQKTVIDFTTWTDRELYNFFATTKAHVCGRYLATQVDRPIHIPPQPHSRLYRLAAALGMTILVAQAPHAMAQSRPPLVAQADSVKGKVSLKTTTNGTLGGKIIDDKKEPIINAAIQVFQSDVLKGGIVTDYDGNYEIKPLDEGRYKLIVTYPGYDSIVLNDVLIRREQHTTCNFEMKMPKNTSLRVPIILGGPMRPLVDYKK